MKKSLFGLCALIVLFAGSVYPAQAQCSVVNVWNYGPCTAEITLHIGGGIYAPYQIAPGAGATIPAPRGYTWISLETVGTVQPCSGNWIQNVSLPLGGPFAVMAPLPAPFLSVTVKGCDIVIR